MTEADAVTRVPDLDALRLLVALASEGSIGGAARVRGISQQSASERVRSMEAQVGLALVRRTARGSELTPTGVVLVEWANRLLDVADEIDHAIESLRGDRTRELSVSASMTVAESLLPRWLVLLRQRQLAEGRTPTTVSLSAANSRAVAEAVRSQAADVGFVEGAEPPAGLQAVAVASDALVLVCAPGSPLSRRRRGVDAVEVSSLSLTVRESGSGTREVLDRALARHGSTLSGALVELTTGSAVRAAVLAGGPPAFLSREVVATDLAAGSLVEVPTSGLDLTRVLRAVWVGGRQPPAGPVRELIGLARTHSARTHSTRSH